MQNSHADQRGLTLVEILVVMVIISVMMAVAGATFWGSKKDAQKKRAVAAARFYQDAIEAYKVDNDGIAPYSFHTDGGGVDSTNPEAKPDVVDGYNRGGWSYCGADTGVGGCAETGEKYMRQHGPINADTGEPYLMGSNPDFVLKIINGKREGGRIWVKFDYNQAGKDSQWTVTYHRWANNVDYSMFLWRFEDDVEKRHPICWMGSQPPSQDPAMWGNLNKLKADLDHIATLKEC